jgi:secondary thiamine-phosphate synthase enzyme
MSGTPERPGWASITVGTEGTVGYTDLGPLLKDAVREGVADGLFHIFVPHTTCTLILNSGVDGTTLTDIRLFIERQLPVDTPFVHTHDGPQDAAAHVRLVFGTNSLQVPVVDGQIALGGSQGIYLLELDGPRTRTVSYATSSLTS